VNYERQNFASADDLAAAAAAAWLTAVEAAGGGGHRFTVALSGGRFVQTLFRHVVRLAREKETRWDHVHFFWADERCVPPDHTDSNFKLAQENLFSPLGIPAGNLHRLRGELDPAEAVRQANDDFMRSVSGGEFGFPALDLVLLGMGEDGHVASLFPLAGSAVENGTAPFLAIYDSPKPPPRRISLSYPMIGAARNVWVLITGAGKADALQESLKMGGKTPLARVLRDRKGSKLIIYADFLNF